MPLRDRHLEALHRDLGVHEELLKQLRNELDRIVQELAIHEVILALGRDEELLHLLGDMADNSDVAREAAKDFRSYASGRGIRLPEEVEPSVEIHQGRVAVRGSFRGATHPFEVVWESDVGFRARSLQEKAAKEQAEKGDKFAEKLIGIAASREREAPD